MLNLGVRLKKLEGFIGASKTQHIKVDQINKTIDFFYNQPRRYECSPTGFAFHSDDNFVRDIMGPYGSGKSTICAMEILFRASAMPRCIDGVRRLRAAFIRNTSGELETSTYKTWQLWTDELGAVHIRKKPIFTVEHRFNDGHGLIELEIHLIACDREDHIKKFKSTEYTMVYINEACELPKALLDTMKGRIGHRFPSNSICPEPYWCGVIMDTNPPSTDSWLWRLFEQDMPEEHRLFRQPPGLLKTPEGKWIANPDAENMANLDPKYYLRQALGVDEEYIRVFCCGEYGIIRNGKPVYPMYNDDIHCVPHLKIEKDYPLLLQFDFGLTPACLVSQYVDGQKRDIKEFVSDNCMLSDLLDYVVRPWLNEHALGIPYTAVGDPADSDLLHYYNTLRDKGFVVQKAITNDILPRLDAAKSMLSRLVNGKPAYVLSSEGCPKLRAGFIRDYYYKKVHVIGEDRYKEEPYKTHPTSDIHDCNQYGCMQIINDQKIIKSSNPHDFLDDSVQF